LSDAPSGEVGNREQVFDLAIAIIRGGCCYAEVAERVSQVMRGDVGQKPDSVVVVARGCNDIVVVCYPQDVLVA
jgi:hypoxanthine phosphoribosyltransferase